MLIKREWCIDGIGWYGPTAQPASKPVRHFDDWIEVSDVPADVWDAYQNTKRDATLAEHNLRKHFNKF